jgi:SAM-dependent methyltransferase
MDMPKDSDTRVFDKNQALDYAATSAFFRGRGKAAAGNPLTATMYQSEDLATRRDQEEKARALPLLTIRSDDRVLDLGCGTGRWAEAISTQVKAYLGIDFAEDLLDVARQRVPDATFVAMDVAQLKPATFPVPPPFSVVICSGILIYINDDDIRALFGTISSLAAPGCRVYLREPMARDKRLTLDRHWSDELQAHYSAIYRTRDEYLELIGSLAGFSVVAEGTPFPDELQNRVETSQRYMLLSRDGA